MINESLPPEHEEPSGSRAICICWIKYYRHGKSYAESTHSDKTEVATRILKMREGEIAQGKMPSICFEKVKFDELMDDYVTDYKINGRRTVAKAERCSKYPKDEFQGMKAVEINTPPKVAKVPYIPMMKENNVRKGFLEYDEYIALKKLLPDHLQAVATVAYLTGWRKSEILDLQWNQVYLKDGILRLEPGETKNRDARTLYMEP